MNKYQIQIDTSATSNVTTVSGSSGQPSIFKIAGNPFQVTAILGNRHRNIKEVSLKDAQIPIGWDNIRAPYNTFVINNIKYTVPPNNYTITTLITQLNNTITGSVGTFTVNQVTNVVTLTPVSGILTFSVPPLSLGYFLGFTDGQKGAPIVATNSFFINFDTYISIWIPELGSSSKDTSQTTFKIPVTATFGGVIQYLEASAWAQSVRFTDKGARPDRFTFVVLDRFGNIMSNGGLDWSLTLGIESDT